MSASGGQEHLSNMFTVPGMALSEYLLDIIKCLCNSQTTDRHVPRALLSLSERDRSKIIKFLITFHF